MTDARAALQLETDSSSEPKTFETVEAIHTYIQQFVVYLSLLKGFTDDASATAPPPSTASASATTEHDAKTTPLTSLRQPLINDDHTPSAVMRNEAASNTRSISYCVHFCSWQDVLSNSELYAVNASHEYAQVLLAGGLLMMQHARDKVDVLLDARPSEIDENELKLAYQLLLHAAGTFEACLQSMGITSRLIGADPTDFSAEPEPRNAVEPASSKPPSPDGDAMTEWRLEQEQAAGLAPPLSSAAATTASTAPSTRNRPELAKLDAVPDLTHGYFPQLLAWIALAEAQELVVLRGVSRDKADFALMARLAMDISQRFRGAYLVFSPLESCLLLTCCASLSRMSVFYGAVASMRLLRHREQAAAVLWVQG